MNEGERYPEDGHPDLPDSRQKQRRGFASMDAEQQREIARKGGRAAHMKGTAHEFTAREARAAGIKGGQKVSQNREHMATIGRRGGQNKAIFAEQQRARRRLEEESRDGSDR